MGWKRLVIISGLFLLVSCVSFYHHPKGGFRPKKPNFSLAKEGFVYNKSIDTMAIYTFIDTLKYGDFKSVSYIKLFNNGRMFRNSFDPDVGISEKNFWPSMIGYYTLNKDSIHIEYYSVDALNKHRTEYVNQKGVVKSDTIFLKNEVDTSYIEIYVKQKLNFSPEPSD